ncbi:hypothetical protein NG702_15080 [Pseudarthrobacter sp. MDT3-28]|uniref:hypothetical protein n=1 Tax=Pseudarthrobacter raffinosi TaxID=2953651 RepID=UPI00208E6DB8|nr:hypothetical protein [Pseudarthrobacter sp. MDT3-28]MCO4238718.1 hypothetical protein [Pseudarthrobacter sp. MDT3-28]
MKTKLGFGCDTTFIYGELEGDLLGFYDHSTGNTHVDVRLSRRNQHITITHEGFHRMGRHGPAPSAVVVASEIGVELMTAHYFIGFRSLLDGFIQCGSAAELAKFLHVDKGLVYARMLGLTKAEQLMLVVCGRHCIGVDTGEPQVPPDPVAWPNLPGLTYEVKP